MSTGLIVRVDAPPGATHARIANQDGSLCLFAPTDRVRARFRSGEHVAFFKAHLAQGIVELDERIHPAIPWGIVVPTPRPVAANPTPAPAVIVCPCGAARNHKGLCRDAVAALQGRTHHFYKA